jgi:Tol biopolymer transport system component
MVNADGTNLRRLTYDRAVDYNPAWSPDGERILFQSNRGGTYNIYSIDLGGRQTQRLTDPNTISFDPAWSPDGSWIAYFSNANGTRDVYVLRLADGTGVCLTCIPGGYNFNYSGSPTWSPDGARIAYDSDQPHDPLRLYTSWAVYLMNADGTNRSFVVDGMRPAWRPQPAPF